MNTKLRMEANNDFERDFLKLMNNAVFGKSMGNVRKYRDIKLVTTDKRRNNVVSEPNYHAIKWFSENLVAIEMGKIKVKMNKPIYVGMAILDISKTLMYEFWYGYLKPKYEDRIELCYMHNVLSLLSKQKIFMRILLMMVIKDLIRQIINLIDLCLQEKIKKQ